jgi:release factor glutamine methyltransferase
MTWHFPDDPLSAIDGGTDGLDIARACLDVIAAHLAPGGAAVLQLGTAAQAETLAREEWFTAGPLVQVEVRQHVRGVLVRIDRPA